MVKLLDPTEVDPISEQVEQALDEADAAEAETAAEWARSLFPASPPGDLSDGGMVGRVRVRPSADKTVTQGRPAARQAWMWNGTESVLALAWTPDGKRHDGGRHYLLKQHCLCCHRAGFIGLVCPECRKRNCSRCRASTDRASVQTLGNGKTVRGWIIPNFYLRREDVPFPVKFFGSVDCIFEFCPRRGAMGFLTEEEMRLHASKRHRDEYKARQETLAAANESQVTILQRRVDELMARLLPQASTPAATEPTARAERAVATSGKAWTPERRRAASVAAKNRAAGGVAKQ